VSPSGKATPNQRLLAVWERSSSSSKLAVAEPRLNDQGYLASNIGTPENPWFVTVHVEGNLTSLRGNRASVIGGYVVFSELTVLAVASNISLVYEIEKPANLNEYERKIK